MNTHSRIAVVVGLIVQFASSGCVTHDTPGDLTLTSVRVVDYAQQEELPRPGSPAAFVGIFGAIGPMTLGQGNGRDKPHQPLLLATVKSATDLSQLSFTPTMGLESYFCGWPDRFVRLDLPYIYNRGRDVRLGPLPGSRDEALGNLFTYDIYFPLARNARVEQNPRFQDYAYNLITKPEDICFNIVGGEYRRFGYSSNTVTIPKDEISAAIEKDLPKLFPNRSRDFELD